MKLFHFLTHQCPQLLGYCSMVLLDVTIGGTGWRVQEPSLYQCFHESKIPQNKKGRRKKDPCCQWTRTPFSRPVNSSWKATIKGGSPIGLARTQGHPLPTLGTVTEVARPVQEPTMDGSLRRVCRLRGPCLQTDLPRATSDRNKALFHGALPQRAGWTEATRKSVQMWVRSPLSLNSPMSYQEQGGQQEDGRQHFKFTIKGGKVRVLEMLLAQLLKSVRRQKCAKCQSQTGNISFFLFV